MFQGMASLPCTQTVKSSILFVSTRFVNVEVSMNSPEPKILKAGDTIWLATKTGGLPGLPEGRYSVVEGVTPEPEQNENDFDGVAGMIDTSAMIVVEYAGHNYLVDLLDRKWEIIEQI